MIEVRSLQELSKVKLDIKYKSTILDYYTSCIEDIKLKESLSEATGGNLFVLTEANEVERAVENTLNNYDGEVDFLGKDPVEHVIIVGWVTNNAGGPAYALIREFYPRHYDKVEGLINAFQ